MTQPNVIQKAVKAYLKYAMEFYYRDQQIINVEEIPLTGPTIIYGNHNNLFVDGAMFYIHPKRLVSGIAAAISCKKPIIGPMLLASGGIPVQRPIDNSRQGKGKIIKIQRNIIRGQGTNFLNLKKGQSIELNQNRLQIYIKEVISDTKIITNTQIPEMNRQFSYKILDKINYEDTFNAVCYSLKKGACIGMSPEGKSNDTLELLTIKAGICIMALGTYERYGIPVKFVPYYLTFQRPYDFRQKYMMEFGKMFQTPKDILQVYKQDKRQGVNRLLKYVENGLRELMIDFPYYEETPAMFLSRQLYVLSSNKSITPKQECQLNRRFARGYSLAMQHPQYNEPRKKLAQFYNFVRKHNILLKEANIKINKISCLIQAIGNSLNIASLSLLALPAYIMYLPAVKICQFLAEKQRSRVTKLYQSKGRRKDVIASFIIIYATAMFPLTAGLYSFVVYYLLKKWTKTSTRMRVFAALVFFLIQPKYGRLYVNLYDSIKESWGKLKLLLWFIFKKDSYINFVRWKEDMQRQIIQCVNEVGQELFKNYEDIRIIKDENIIDRFRNDRN